MRFRKLLLTTLVCSSTAWAGPTGQPPVTDTDLPQGSDKLRAAAQILALYHNELDCENVGYIQTGEADEHFAPIFLASDRDNSRTLSKAEFLSNPYAKDRALLEVSFSEMDFDGDGVTTPDELRGYLNNAVDSVDSNADGDVYPIEIQYAMKTGLTLQSEASAKAHNKPVQAKIAPPWVRHAKAVNQPKSPQKPAEKASPADVVEISPSDGD